MHVLCGCVFNNQLSSLLYLMKQYNNYILACNDDKRLPYMVKFILINSVKNMGHTLLFVEECLHT